MDEARSRGGALRRRVGFFGVVGSQVICKVWPRCACESIGCPVGTDVENTKALLVVEADCCFTASRAFPVVRRYEQVRERGLRAYRYSQ